MRTNSLTAGISIIAVTFGAAWTVACQRSNKNAPPSAQIQTQTPPQTVNQPLTVTGCLRAGDASDTYVLTTSETKDGTTPATYLLVASNGANLRDNVGNRVEVSGVLSTQQAVSTVTPPTAPQNKPTGTGGTPTVETQTQLDMRRLEVNSLNRVAEHCDTKK
jgi:hypothetical protein